MLATYHLDGRELDSLDLKVLLITRGIKVNGRVYEALARSSRISPDPLRCNCLILPDSTVVHLIDLAMHMGFVKAVLSWETWRNLRYVFQMQTPFSLDLDDTDRPTLFWEGKPITPVSFPPVSQFYEQVTSSCFPFIGNAVLQANDFLSFQCLWPCQYAKAGHSCQFCHAGGAAERLARSGRLDPPQPTPEDVAEIVHYAFEVEHAVRHLQLTGGSTMNVHAECELLKTFLVAILRNVSRDRIPGEILLFTTPPQDPHDLDQLFDAGADRIACSLEVWDLELAKTITPGKLHFAGRQRYLDCLKYIVQRYGPNRACSSFVVGLEPAESYLEGARILASEGIVPLAAVWLPFGRPVRGTMRAPGLDYYRRIKEGLAEIYATYETEPPGTRGGNVCLGRDIWNHRRELTASERRSPGLREVEAGAPTTF